MTNSDLSVKPGDVVLWRGNLVTTRKDVGTCQKGQCSGIVLYETTSTNPAIRTFRVIWQKLCKNHKEYWSEDADSFIETCKTADLLAK